jgi:hypothetical protein
MILRAPDLNPQLQLRGDKMPFWQRLLITLAAMLVVSFMIGYLSRSMLGFALPDYASGVIGGLTAIPVWEFLKRIKPKV